MSLSVPFIIITQTSTSILQGIGSYIIPVINLFIGCIVKVILTMVLVPMRDFNIYGAVAASIGAYVVATILNVIAMKVKLKVRLNLYKNFIKPACAASVMMLVVLIIYNVMYSLTLSNSISCLLSIGIGAIIYAIGIILLKVFSVQDIKDKLNRNNI